MTCPRINPACDITVARAPAQTVATSQVHCGKCQREDHFLNEAPFSSVRCCVPVPCVCVDSPLSPLVHMSGRVVSPLGRSVVVMLMSTTSYSTAQTMTTRPCHVTTGRGVDIRHRLMTDVLENVNDLMEAISSDNELINKCIIKYG